VNDALQMLAGAAIVWGSMLVNRLAPRRREPKPVKPICGCKHGIGFHADKAGACSFTANQHQGYDKNGAAVYANVRCTCLHYDGPIPVESMFSTPLLPPRET
jgi:hypothetical protein